MAPLFAAFDIPYQTKYQKFIPRHLADILTYPEKIRQCFEHGAFVVSITSRPGHSVTLDECHAMCINKDMKCAIVHPTKPYIQKTLSYRIAAYKNLLAQLFPNNKTPERHTEVLFDITAEVHQREENIEQMQLEISIKKLLLFSSVSSRGLLNVFTGAKATPEQSHDLLIFLQSWDQGRGKFCTPPHPLTAKLFCSTSEEAQALDNGSCNNRKEKNFPK